MAKKKRIYGEGTITPRKDGRYQIAVPDPNAKNGRRYAYAANQKEAEKERRRLLAEIEQGKEPASKQLFQAHVREWLEMKKKGRGYKPNSYMSAVYCMDAHFIPAFGHVPLNKLSPSHIQKLYNRLLDKEELSPNTIGNYHSMIKACLDSAVKQGKIDRNPCDRVELPKRVKPKNSYLPQPDAMTLLEAVKGHKLFSVLVPLALATQARESELLALTWDDIDLDRGTISINKTLTRDMQQSEEGKHSYTLLTVTPKSESGIRPISLPDFAIAALKTHRTSQTKQALASGKHNTLNLLFIARKGGYYQPPSVSKCFTEFVKRRGFDITFHDLRHTGATFLLESGVDPNVVKERLGHSHVSTTLGVYGHVTRKMKDKSVNALNSFLTDQENGKNEAI